MLGNIILTVNRSKNIITSGGIGATDLFYAKLLQRKSFKYWKRYAIRKIQKARAKYKAEYYYKMKLKQKVLQILSQNVTYQRNLNLASLKLTLMYKRMLLSNAWKKWRLVVQDLYDSVPKSYVHMAKCFHKQAILRRCFHCWIKNISNRHEKMRLKRLGAHFSQRLHFNRYIRIWKIIHQRRKQNTLLEEKVFSEFDLLSNTVQISDILVFIYMCFQLHIQATKFYHDLLIECAIKQWIEAHNRIINLKLLWKQAVAHYEKKLLSKIVVAWITFCNINIQMHNLERDAQNYHREKLLHKCLKKLTLNACESKNNKTNIQMANNFYKTKILHRIISKWKAYHIQLIEYSMKIKTICSALEIRLKTKILYHWKLYVVHKKCNRRRMFVSCNHYRKTSLSKGLKKLRAYLKYKKIKKLQMSYMTNALDKIEMNFQKMYLVKWRNALFDVAREKHKILKAEEFHVKILTRKYIHRWMIFFQEHKVKKLRKKKLFNRAQFVFLKRFISIWYTKYQRALKDHDKENWANVTYEIKLKKKFFNIWKKYIKVRIEKRLEYQAAKEFHKKLVLQEGLRHIFRICLYKIDERYESREKEIVRNALQDFEILKKFFNKWLRTVSTLSRDKKSNMDNIVRKNISKEKRPRLIIPSFIKNSASFPNIMKTAEKFNYENNYKSHMLDEEHESLRFDQTDRKNLNICRNDVNEKTLSSESYSADIFESTLNSTNVDNSQFFQNVIKKSSPIQLNKDTCTLTKPKGVSQTLLPPSAFYVTSSNCSKSY